MKLHGWSLINEEASTYASYFTRNENPFTTNIWQHVPDPEDDTPATITFSDFQFLPQV